MAKLRNYLLILDGDSSVELEGKTSNISSRLELSSILAEFAVREGLIINELHKLEPSLEQAVIKLSKNIEREEKGIA